MKSSIRVIAMMGVIFVLIAASLIHASSDRLGMASTAAGEAREATLHSYRIAQSLKSLSNGYELAMNEYYSTVLEFHVYRQKAADHQAAIERELTALAKLGTGDATAVAKLTRAFQEMEAFRAALEGALSSADKDWDGAREALFKLNVVSVRAIQQADILARIADERAVALDRDWQELQSEALTMLRVAMAVVLAAVALIAFGTWRPCRLTPET
jgi:hypothetical protein